ncbi:MAG TPA: putative Ig domain-containing protein, partial [Vicinamibacterales bacterium]|nr:putative Ig domain-containing protein [Vicinamibacterales bacterium]
HTQTSFFAVSIYPAGAAPPVAISTNANFGTWSVGQSETPLTATGGTGTYTWSKVSGTLPPGLAVRQDLPTCCFSNGASGGLIGVATTAGTYSFTLQVSDGSQTATRAFTMKVTALTTKENQLPDAFVGAPYTPYTLTALNGFGGSTGTWTATNPLPAGMTLSPSGVLSGTPTAAGFSSINFTVFDGVDTINRSVSLNVYAVRITTPGVLPNATSGGSYNTTIAAAGGTGPFSFSANGLPNGLSIGPSTGVISGTVSSGNGSSVGKVSVSVTASNSGGSYTKTMSIDVVGTPASLPSIAPAVSPIPDCTLGVPCTRTISVRNGGTAPFAWTASGLPPGMTVRFGGNGETLSSVTPGDAELWGTATAAGTFNVQLTVTDAGGMTATNTFPMTISPLLQTAFLQNGTRGTAYSQALRVIGGRGPYTVAGAPLPAGLSLSGLTLAGTPAENGNFNLPLQYSDADGLTLRSTAFLFISGGASTIGISNNGDLGSISVGSSYSSTLNSLNACCNSPYTWSVTGGTKPPELTLSSTTGQWSGTASTVGLYTFLVKAAQTSNPANFGVRQFTLNVTPISVTTNSTLPFGNVGVFYSQTLAATGGTGAVSWALAAGSYLPPGLALTSGVLSGTPAFSGQYQFTLTAADTGGHTRTSLFSVSIYPAGGGPPVAISTNTNFGTWSIGQIETALTATGGGGAGSYGWSLSAGSLPPGISI